MGADGLAVSDLPQDEVIVAAEMLVEEGIESVAVCYINSASTRRTNAGLWRFWRRIFPSCS